MIDKIVALFATHEKCNHDLAVELMKGQGISLVDVFEHTPAYMDVKEYDFYHLVGLNPVYENREGFSELNIGDFRVVIFGIIPPCIFKGKKEIKEGDYFGNAHEANFNFIRFIRENQDILGI